MKTNTRLSLIALAAIACLLSASPAAANGTPDGVTPAVEGVCDGFLGGVPGLYGLCVAYCEAQDQDAYPHDPNGSRLEGNARRRGGNGMPCAGLPPEIPQ